MAETAEPAVFWHLIIDSYVGERDSDGQFHGLGKIETLTGGQYNGSFSRGFMDGDGEFAWPDETRYKGQFKLNTITGNGNYTWYEKQSLSLIKEV